MPPVHLDNAVGGSQPRQPTEIHTSREGQSSRHLRKMLGKNGAVLLQEPEEDLAWAGR